MVARRDSWFASLSPCSLPALRSALPGARAGRARPTPRTAAFSFHGSQDGFLRLDTRTGQVSLCSRRTVGWACRAGRRTSAPRSKSEIARLQTDNAALKKEMLARGLPLPSGMKAEPPVARGSDQELKLPSNAELDRMMAFMEKVWRRMVEMMVNIQRDMQKKS